MKKSTIPFAIAFVTLLACNQNKGPKEQIQAPKGQIPFDSSQATPSTFKKGDSIPGITALAMIKHYRDHYMDGTLIGHSSMDTAIITLNNSDIIKFFELDNITRIRFITAAYLPSSPDSLRNKITILTQLKQGYNSNYYYYDIQTFSALCPPPIGCSIQ